MNRFSFTSTSMLDEAVAQLQGTPSTHFIAGGTNLLDLMKYFVVKPEILLDINQIEELKTISELPGGGLRIGALATNAETAYHPKVESHYPLLSRAILAGASAQIRNMATNGGNLLQKTRCYYFYDPETPCNKRNPGSGCSAVGGYNRNMAIIGTSEHCIAVFPSDMCVALAALDASVNVTSARGSRTIPFADFHRLAGDTPHLDNTLAADEIITSIDLPRHGFSHHYSYLKLRDRGSYAFALVSVATALQLKEGKIDRARISLGGIAHKPWRVTAAEEWLIGKHPTPENFGHAAHLILAGAKGFEFNQFKIRLAQKAIVRNSMMALQPECQLPGAGPSI